MDVCVQLGFKQKESASKVLFSAVLGHTTSKDLYDGFTTVLNNGILPKILLTGNFLMHLMMTLRKNLRPRL